MAKHPHPRLSFFLLIACVVLVQRSNCSGPSSSPVEPAQAQEPPAAAAPPVLVHGDVDQPRRGEITSASQTAGRRSAVTELVVGGRGADQADDGTPPSSPAATIAAVGGGDVDGSSRRRSGGAPAVQARGRSAVKELVIGGRGANQADGTPPSSPAATVAAVGGDDADGSSRRRSSGAPAVQAGGRYAVPHLKLARRFLAGGEETAADSAAGASCRSNNAHITCSPAAPH